MFYFYLHELSLMCYFKQTVWWTMNEKVCASFTLGSSFGKQWTKYVSCYVNWSWYCILRGYSILISISNLQKCECTFNSMWFIFKYQMEVYLFKCNVFVVTRANNTGGRKEGYKYLCLLHNDVWRRERWSSWMLQKIQTLSHFSCYLPSIRQNGFLRSFLQRYGEWTSDVFIWLGNTDIYTTNIFNQVQIELFPWKTSIQECIDQITFDKKMLRNYQNVRIVLFFWIVLKLSFIYVYYYVYFTLLIIQIK